MTKPSLEEYAEDATQAQFAENQRLGRQLRAARAELSKERAGRIHAEEALSGLEKVYAEAVQLEPKPDWLRPATPRADRNRATLVAVLSDIHAGEVVRPEEMGGYNAFNLEIAEKRLRRFFEETIELARSYIAGVDYDGITLVLGGDMVSGDIHDELQQTNELSVLDTTLWVAPRLVAGIERWAEEFGAVHVVSVPGNHGRDSKVPRHKKRSAHNADTHIAKMAALYYSQANPNGAVTFDIPDSYDATFSIYEHSFAVEHGDNLRFTGVSEIGALGPVKRGTLRKARAKQEEGDPFDYLLVGHFHQLVYAPNQGFVMNGTLKGYDEFAKAWSLKPEPPQQALFVVSPEYGAGGHMPIVVGKRDDEGW